MATWSCWALVGVVWVAGAVLGRQRGPNTRRRAGRDLVSLAGIAVGVIAVTTPEAWWDPLTVGSPWIRVAGVAVLLPATAATIWARVALGDMWSAAAVVKQGHALRTSGPYRITRHPIYTGFLAMLAGTALIQGLGRFAGVLVAAVVVLAVKIRAEERLLSAEFPEEYALYRQQVPRLVPRLHRI